MTNYFADCPSPEARKARYRELAKKHHPDITGDDAVMKEVNRQYHGVHHQEKAQERAWEAHQSGYYATTCVWYCFDGSTWKRMG